MSLKGSCPCGAVTLDIAADKPVAYANCHCSQCRRQGKPFGSWVVFPADKVKVTYADKKEEKKDKKEKEDKKEGKGKKVRDFGKRREEEEGKRSWAREKRREENMKRLGIAEDGSAFLAK